MPITLEQTIVHILNSSEAMPIFSDIPLSLNAEVENYLSQTIDRAFQSDDVKSCLFKPESNVWNQCRDFSWKIISKRNSHILKGIICATASVIAGLYLVLVPSSTSQFLAIIYSFMQNAEIVFMAFLIFYFLLSLKEMCVLVNSIHNSKGAKTEADIKELKNKIKSNRKDS